MPTPYDPAWYREYWRRNPDKARRTPEYNRAHYIYGAYRLRWPDYLAMVAEGCGVCACPLLPLGGAATVDHDHSCAHPGKGSASCRACVRGVLCQGCNNRVGQAEQGRHLFDDPRVMAYLGRPVSPGPVQDSLFGEAS